MKNFIPAFIQEKYLKKEFNGDFKSAIISFDIVGFTKITDILISKGKEGAEILAEMINEVFEPSIKEIYLNGGWITGFAGDAFTVVFPGVNPVYALSVSLKIRNIFEDLALVTKFGTFNLDIKIGVSFGRITWDIVTTDIRGIYYFRGEGIKRANLCQMHCKASQIIFDSKMKSVVKEKITFNKSGKYFILNKLVLKQPLKNKKVPYKIKKKILPIFIPDSQLELKEVNEFRKVVSVFISIHKIKDFKGFIKKAMVTTRKFKGYLNKFEYGDKGDVLLVLFGAPIGIERPISHAIDFALELKKNITDGEMRIGITYGTTFSGEVGSDERSEYTVLGKVVNLSARLMMKARWGEILCDESISRGASGEIQFKSIGNIKVKGFRKKQKISNVVGKVRTDFYEFTGKMVGRQAELNKLLKFLKPIDDEKFGGLVYVEGLAGIGKSRLVHELKEKLDLKKYHWLLFVCDEILRQSFNPIIYFLKEYFNQNENLSPAQNKNAFEIKLKYLIKKTNNHKIKDELIRTKPFLGALLNHFWKNSIFDKLSSKEQFDNTLFAFKNLIKAVSLQRKVILVFEDIHWIDSETISLLNVLTRNIEHYPIIIIFITRLKGDGTPFRLEIPDLPFKSILLEHLGKNASINLVKEDLGERVSKKVLDLIWDKSEGNPFFIEQIILYLKETNLLQINKKKILDLKEGEFEIPDQISNIIISRIDRLEAKLKEMVKTASVLGMEVPVKILSEMLRVKRIKTKMKTVEEQGIWTALSEFLYIFKHAMIRDTVYQMQMKKSLKNLHRLAGKAIESVFRKEIKFHYGELALHYENAEVKIKAKYYLEHAGNLTFEQFRNNEALNYYLRLQKYLKSNEEKAHVYLQMGILYKLTAKFDQALVEFRKAKVIAKKIKDKNLLFKSMDFLIGTYWYAMSFKDMHKETNSLLQLAKKINESKYIRIGLKNRGTLYYFEGKYNKALACYMKKLELEKKAKDPGLSLTESYDNIAFMITQLGDYKKALEYYKMSRKACKHSQGIHFIRNHSQSLGNFYAGIGEYEKAEKYYKKLVNVSIKTGDLVARHIGLMGLGYCNLYSGKYNKALESFTNTLEIVKESRNPIGAIYLLMFIGVAYLFQGNFKSSQKYLSKALKSAKRLEDPRLIAAISSKFGSYYLFKKNRKKAEDYFNKGYLGFKKIGMLPEMCSCMISIADLNFKKKNYVKAKKLIAVVLKTSRKIKRKDIIFLASKIEVRLLGLKDKEQAKSEFITMLKNVKKPQQLAALHFELYKLTREEKYKKSSIKLYEKIYKTVPSYLFKLILEELKRG